MESYALPLKVLHWVMGVLVICLIGVGLYMVDLERSDFKMMLYNNHKAIGIIVLGMLVLRLLFRFKSGVPDPHPSLSPFERLASRSVHGFLYLLLLSVPLFGLFATLAFGFGVDMYGLFSIPAFAEADRELGKLLITYHGWGAWVLIAFVALHIGAGLYHALIKKDGVFSRIWF